MVVGDEAGRERRERRGGGLWLVLGMVLDFFFVLVEFLLGEGREVIFFESKSSVKFFVKFC